MKVNLKQITSNAVIAAAVATAFASVSFAQSTTPQSATSQSATAEAAQQALATQMGDSAKDIKVEVQDGIALLSGWAPGPKEVDKARYIVSKVPGIRQSYSAHVRTWSSDSNS